MGEPTIAGNEPTIAAIKPEKFSSAWYSRNAVIYFLAAGEPPKAIKIGMTGRNDLERRMRSIQSSNHERIRLLKVIEFLGGDKPAKRAEDEEQKLHEKFAKLQRAKRGFVGSEWFNWQEPLVSYINALPSLPVEFLALALKLSAGNLPAESALEPDR